MSLTMSLPSDTAPYSVLHEQPPPCFLWIYHLDTTADAHHTEELQTMTDHTETSSALTSTLDSQVTEWREAQQTINTLQAKLNRLHGETSRRHSTLLALLAVTQLVLAVLVLAILIAR
ncbi:MAG: hypothetical protein CMF72_24575 [Mameliella sp.]|nr:hypothetical protein [Mameliella sp.]|tara:strand:+ start:1229 stop:1582 length:354 start_codon:yes stop_codon:yes gene_type:complete